MGFLDTEISYLKGVGPAKADILYKELGVTKIWDLINIFPFRYIDKTKFQNISDARADGDILLLKGTIISLEKSKTKSNRQRLIAVLKDSSGFIELTWFQGVKWAEDSIKTGKEYIVYGRVSVYGGIKSIPHPELEEVGSELVFQQSFEPVYPSSEKLDKSWLDSKGRRKLIKAVFDKISPADLPENLPEEILTRLKLPSRYDCYKWVHFPSNEQEKTLAQNRLKFEEFFFLQIQLLHAREYNKNNVRGPLFEKIGDGFNFFYKEKLPFELTGAQKRVLKQIRADVGRGFQMNRLVQGDVGSGKTIVALLAMLMAIDNGYQTCMMAPTEILANQHFENITELLKGTKIHAALLTGSIKGRKRQDTLRLLQEGSLHILIGTHALIEDHVIFNNLGLAIIDEQHRFGVYQRAKLWEKNKEVVPHVLVMTATPIPRTLAMTLYGDLDVSVIDELPPGRKDVKTIMNFDIHRPKLINFMKEEIAKGRQIYIVYPLIEDSEKLDLQSLMDGYERLLPFFPNDQYHISIVHGKMKAEDKDLEMRRFVEGKTHIMVATTVIEVGVNVPNASVMIIENAERFGLSQLHQLRGRVGRGAEQSYCILMCSHKLSSEAKERLQTMVRTNNGFEIAEADLKLRGPGEIEGTRQSGVTEFKLLNLAKDHKIINAARHIAEQTLDEDPELKLLKNQRIRNYLVSISKNNSVWSRIS